MFERDPERNSEQRKAEQEARLKWVLIIFVVGAVLLAPSYLPGLFGMTAYEMGWAVREFIGDYFLYMVAIVAVVIVAWRVWLRRRRR